MCISVDLPDPDGPMMATYSPGTIVQRHPADRLHRERAGPVGLGDVVQVDEGHRSPAVENLLLDAAPARAAVDEERPPGPPNWPCTPEIRTMFTTTCPPAVRPPLIWVSPPEVSPVVAFFSAWCPPAMTVTWAVPFGARGDRGGRHRQDVRQLAVDDHHRGRGSPHRPVLPVTSMVTGNVATPVSVLAVRPIDAPCR